MPRLISRPPKYRKHRASGQAVVTIDGRDYYLGPYGTKASRVEYDQIISEWMDNGRLAPNGPGAGLTIVELLAAYLRWAKSYYFDSREPQNIKCALRPLNEL